MKPARVLLVLFLAFAAHAHSASVSEMQLSSVLGIRRASLEQNAAVLSQEISRKESLSGATAMQEAGRLRAQLEAVRAEKSVVESLSTQENRSWLTTFVDAARKASGSSGSASISAIPATFLTDVKSNKHLARFWGKEWDKEPQGTMHDLVFRFLFGGYLAAYLNPESTGSDPEISKLLFGNPASMLEIKTVNDLPNAHVLRKVAQSVVGITGVAGNPTGKILGTAFCIEDGYLVTAAHVLYGRNWADRGSRTLSLRHIAVPAKSSVPGVRLTEYDVFDIDARSVVTFGDEDLARFSVSPRKLADGTLEFIRDRCPALEYDAAAQLKPMHDRLSVVGYGQRTFVPIVSMHGLLSDRAPAAAEIEKVRCPIPVISHFMEGMSGGPIVTGSPVRVVGVQVWQSIKDEIGKHAPVNRDSALCGESIASVARAPKAATIAGR
jgi:hypothetical protein